MNSAPSAPADSLLTGVGVAASAATGFSRGRARAAPSAPVGFCAGGIANCAEAFGSASPLQLAKMEEFYVGARLSTNSVHSVFPLDNVTWRREGATSCRGPFAGLQYFPQALDARSHRELLLISFACSSIKGAFFWKVMVACDLGFWDKEARVGTDQRASRRRRAGRNLPFMPP